MASQLFFENVEVGMEIGPLVKHPTSRQLVKWAGASEDFYEIHYDKDFALSTGLPSPIVHGRLKAAFLGQLMTDWAGDKGIVRKLSCTYRGMDIVGEDVICKGRVTQKYVEDDANCVECEIWTENRKGERTTPGSAIVVLPTRG
ncbi:MAG: MaoC/PaaZ C-terminal domain-containing protein [Chloroflexota bacterium]|nr:MaoC/PaaZ C-terminal domain-containing protein [Chloroflexota bacterium]